MLAQESLKGCWKLYESKMGITATELLSFDSDSAGNVLTRLDVVMDVDMLGVKMTGKVCSSVRGTFTFDADVLKIKWDRKSFRKSYPKPVEVYLKGELQPEMNSKAKEMLDEVMAELSESFENETVFSDVSFKKGRMTLKGEDDKGNSVKQSFNFVSK